MSGANLSCANLRNADLCNANLRGADMSGANLSGANLSGAIGNQRNLKSIFVAEEYPIAYTADVLQIGCKRYPIAEWWDFTDEEIVAMDGKKALKFWREWKDTIRMIIEKSPAVENNRRTNDETIWSRSRKSWCDCVHQTGFPSKCSLLGCA